MYNNTIGTTYTGIEYWSVMLSDTELLFQFPFLNFSLGYVLNLYAFPAQTYKVLTHGGGDKISLTP